MHMKLVHTNFDKDFWCLGWVFLIVLSPGRRQDLDDDVSGGVGKFRIKQNKQAEDVDELQRGHVGGQDDMVDKQTKEKEDKRLTPHVTMMRPILRYLQLLCENHNRDLQVRRL